MEEGPQLWGEAFYGDTCRADRAESGPVMDLTCGVRPSTGTVPGLFHGEGSKAASEACCVAG